MSQPNDDFMNIYKIVNIIDKLVTAAADLDLGIFKSQSIEHWQNVLNERSNTLLNTKHLIECIITTAKYVKGSDALELKKIREAKTSIEQLIRETDEQIERIGKLAIKNQTPPTQRELQIRGKILAAIANGATADTIAALEAELKTQQDGIKLEGSNVALAALTLTHACDVHVADGYVLHVTHDQHGQTVLTVKSDTGCGTIATITVPAAPAAGHVRCDINERELVDLNERREDIILCNLSQILQQEIMHTADIPAAFDADATAAFVEHMTKLYARLAEMKKELTDVVVPVTIIARGER
jgi:hypothetical protein